MIILHVEFMINPSGSVSGGMKIGIYYSFEKKKHPVSQDDINVHH